MTCVAGIVSNGVIHLAGDSACVTGIDITIRKDKKVFENGEFVIGFSGSFRMGQILKYDFIPPKIKDSDLMSYMVRMFVPAVLKCFNDKGVNYQESDGCFLVGVRGCLFSIDSEFQIGENLCGYAAIGCGESYAYGSLFTSSEDHTLNPEWRLQKALEAAAEFSGGVCAPFNFVNT